MKRINCLLIGLCLFLAPASVQAANGYWGSMVWGTDTWWKDYCPADPDKAEPGVCGCGAADTDTDADVVFDCYDNCDEVANPGQEDADGDNIGDACEILGDANSDRVVNLNDYRYAKTLLGKRIGDPGWDNEADMNGDDVITSKDLRLLVRLLRRR